MEERPIKVLHVVSSLGMYGKEQVILELMRQHQEMGIHSVLGSLRLPGELEKEIEKAAREQGLVVAPFVLKRGMDFRGSRVILEYAKREGVDLLHCHDYKASILLGFQRPFRQMPPLIRTLHGFTRTQPFSRIAINEWLDRLSLRFHDLLVAVSKDMRSTLSLRLTVIKNGIAPLSGDTPAMPSALASFCDDGVVVGSLARLSHEKNQHALVRAVALLRREGWPVKLLIMGDGPEQESLEALIKELKLEEYVRLSGFVRGARRALPRLSIYVQPSLREGTPISVLEAMEAGVPLCLSEVGAMEALVEKGAAFPCPLDAEGIAASLRQLMDNKALCDALTQQARAIFAEEYTSRVMAQQYRDAYATVLRASRSLPS